MVLMESFTRFKCLVCDVTIAHKAIIPRFGEVKVCCAKFL
jgi:hypothetical protein